MVHSPELETRLLAIDLRDLPEDRMGALRRAAISKGVSLARYLTELVSEKSETLLTPRPPRPPLPSPSPPLDSGPDPDPDGRAARAAGVSLLTSPGSTELGSGSGREGDGN